MNAEVPPWALSIPSGIRDRVIDTDELHAAWLQFKAERRAAGEQAQRT